MGISAERMDGTDGTVSGQAGVVEVAAGPVGLWLPGRLFAHASMHVRKSSRLLPGVDGKRTEP